jgi:hypothetical protein
MTAPQVGNIVANQANSLTNLWADFDNDGDLDCFVTNDPTAPSWYYANNGDGTFTQIDTVAVAGPSPTYGATAGDYDRDGDLDLFVSGTNATKGLFRNDLSSGNNWLNVRCLGVV